MTWSDQPKFLCRTIRIPFVGVNQTFSSNMRSTTAAHITTIKLPILYLINQQKHIRQRNKLQESFQTEHQTPQQDDSTRDRIKRSCLRNITPSRTIMMMINHGIQCRHLHLHRKHLLLVFLRQVRCHMTINTNDVKSLLSKMKRSVHTKQRY